MSAPTDLEDLGYGRGQLRPAPAQSVRRLDVRLGRPLDVNSAYRDYDEQMKAYNAYLAYLQGRGPWAPLALHPDKSWHCKGMALDSDDGPGYGGKLTREIWREYGWLFEVTSEPWHGQYYTSLDRHYGEPAGGSEKPFPTPSPDEPTTTTGEEDDDMERMVYVKAPDGRVWGIDTLRGTKRALQPAEWTAVRANGYTLALTEVAIADLDKLPTQTAKVF